MGRIGIYGGSFNPPHNGHMEAARFAIGALRLDRLIVIPAAFLSAFVFHFPVVITFACLKSDQILKCFVALVKVNRFRWIRILTREENSN